MNKLRCSATAMKIFSNKFPAVPSFTLLIFMLLSPFSYAGDSVIGKVISVTGNTTIKQVNQDPVRSNDDDEIHITDLIKTEDDSSLVISFVDGAKVTLRPNTILYVKQYDRDQANISLVNGGIRVIVGEIAKRNPASFKVITPDGVVTAQRKESDFAVRICTQDCNEENERFGGPKINTDLPVVAKIVALQGQVEVSGKKKRSLAVGNFVYNAEKLASGENSYAQLQFEDGSSLTIQEKSSIAINDFKYNKTGYEDRSIFSLVAGGLRYVTGLMGKQDRTTFRLNTSVATIGIRGTDFSVNCVGECSAGGIVTHVFEGSISHQNDSGKYIASKGEYTFIKSRQSSPDTTSKAPVTFDNNIAPPPSEVQVDIENLFTTSADLVEPGTHVFVEAGQISIVSAADENPVVVGANLAVSVEPSGSVSGLSGPNSFQTMDAFFGSSLSGSSSDINTIVIGGSGGDSSSTAGSSVIQEMTIASPY